MLVFEDGNLIDEYDKLKLDFDSLRLLVFLLLIELLSIISFSLDLSKIIWDSFLLFF